MVTVTFGSKKFEVTKNKIYTPDDIKISESLLTEEKEVNGKKPTLTIKGVGLQSISMSVRLDCRFVNVETELRFWKSKISSRKKDVLMIGDYQVGMMILTSYEISDIVLAKSGEYISAFINLTFTEDGAWANSNNAINFSVPQKVVAVKKTPAKPSEKSLLLAVGTTIKPKKGVRWYYTAEGALKKTGKSGSAYQKNMKVSYVYKKNGKVVCVNPQGLGWLIVADVNIVSSSSGKIQFN